MATASVTSTRPSLSKSWVSLQRVTGRSLRVQDFPQRRSGRIPPPLNSNAAKTPAKVFGHLLSVLRHWFCPPCSPPKVRGATGAGIDRANWPRTGGGTEMKTLRGCPGGGAAWWSGQCVTVGGSSVHVPLRFAFPDRRLPRMDDTKNPLASRKRESVRARIVFLPQRSTKWAAPTPLGRWQRFASNWATSLGQGCSGCCFARFGLF